MRRQAYLSTAPLMAFTLLMAVFVPTTCNDAGISLNNITEAGATSREIFPDKNASLDQKEPITDFIEVHTTVFIKLNNRLSTMDEETIPDFESVCLQFLSQYVRNSTKIIVTSVSVISQTNTISNSMGYSYNAGNKGDQRSPNSNRKASIALADVIVEIKATGQYDLAKHIYTLDNSEPMPTEFFKGFVLTMFAENFFQFLKTLSLTSNTYFVDLVRNNTFTSNDPMPEKSIVTETALTLISNTLNSNIMFASVIVGASVAIIASVFFMHQYSKSIKPHQIQGPSLTTYTEKKSHRSGPTVLLPVCSTSTRSRNKAAVPMFGTVTNTLQEQIKNNMIKCISSDYMDNQCIVSQSTSLGDSMENADVEQNQIMKRSDCTDTLQKSNDWIRENEVHYAEVRTQQEKNNVVRDQENNEERIDEETSIRTNGETVTDNTTLQNESNLMKDDERYQSERKNISLKRSTRTREKSLRKLRSISRESSYKKNPFRIKNQESCDYLKKFCYVCVNDINSESRDWFSKTTSKIRFSLGMPFFQDEMSLIESRASSYDESTLTTFVSINPDFDTYDATTVFSGDESVIKKYMKKNYDLKKGVRSDVLKLTQNAISIAHSDGSTFSQNDMGQEVTVGSYNTEYYVDDQTNRSSNESLRNKIDRNEIGNSKSPTRTNENAHLRDRIKANNIPQSHEIATKHLPLDLKQFSYRDETAHQERGARINRSTRNEKTGSEFEKVAVSNHGRRDKAQDSEYSRSQSNSKSWDVLRIGNSYERDDPRDHDDIHLSTTRKYQNNNKSDNERYRLPQLSQQSRSSSQNNLKQDRTSNSNKSAYQICKEKPSKGCHQMALGGSTDSRRTRLSMPSHVSSRNYSSVTTGASSSKQTTSKTVRVANGQKYKYTR